MFRQISRAIFAFSLIVGTPFAAAQRVVNVYNWSDYVTEDALKRFTKESGIKVVYDVYDNNEVLEAKLLAGKSGYDVIFPHPALRCRRPKSRCRSLLVSR